MASIPLGVAAAVISTAWFCVAILAATVISLMREFDVDAGLAIEAVTSSLGDVARGYLSESPLSYLFVGLAAVPPFIRVSGLRR